VHSSDDGNDRISTPNREQARPGSASETHNGSGSIRDAADRSSVSTNRYPPPLSATVRNSGQVPAVTDLSRPPAPSHRTGQHPVVRPPGPDGPRSSPPPGRQAPEQRPDLARHDLVRPDPGHAARPDQRQQGAPAWQESSLDTLRSRMEADGPTPPRRPRRLGRMAAVATLLAAAAGGLYYAEANGMVPSLASIVDRSATDDSVEATGSPPTTAATAAVTEAASGVAEVGTESDAPANLADPDRQLLTDLEPALFTIALSDPADRTDATGSARLDLLPATEEACFSVGTEGLAAPFNTHVHRGVAGERGPVVIDFGPHGDGDACVEVPTADLAAVLADPAGHYFELHEPDDGPAIRGQLDDAAAADTAAGQPGDGDGFYDPDGGGAVARLNSTTVTLEGAVPDTETADRYLRDFSGIDGLTVVDQLIIDRDAPAPTGRVTIDTPVIFASGEATLDRISNGALIFRIAALLQARPEWRMAIVGHTDNLGDPVANYELSFARASSIRQALVGQGVNEDRLTVRGAGSDSPVASNATEEGRAANRRIELVIDAAG
jgi:outer membrane protein OmpA-like peptidoglycan-associated protein